MSRSGSTSILYPRPVQVGHAPWGLLKLKVRGSSSPRLMLQWTQANCSEKSSSSLSSTETSTTPPAILRAVSTESATRPRSALSPMTSLSTTISMVCHFFLFRSKVSERVVDLAVDSHPDEARPPRLLEDFLVLALAASDHRGHDLHAAAIGQVQNGINDSGLDWRCLAGTGRPHL